MTQLISNAMHIDPPSDDAPMDPPDIKLEQEDSGKKETSMPGICVLSPPSKDNQEACAHPIETPDRFNGHLMKSPHSRRGSSDVQKPAPKSGSYHFVTK